MRNEQFLTIVRDLRSSVVIHVGNGKGISALARALKKLKNSKLRVVELISKHFPKADIVLDHFHVIKLMNDKLDKVRKRVTAKLDATQQKQLK